MTADHTIKDLCLTETQYFGFEAQGHTSILLSAQTSVAIAVSRFGYQNTSKLGTNTKVDSKADNNALLIKAQKSAVRKLLFQLVFEKTKDRVFSYVECGHVDLLKVSGLRLLESTYPYRLLPFNYHVCFTHSANKIACAIHTKKPIGIDLEIHPVSMKVAQRFYTLAEKKWLAQLDNDLLPQALNLLWQLKEAYIKQSKANDANLLSGLKTNQLSAAQKLIPESTTNQDWATNISTVNTNAAAQTYYYQDSTYPKNTTTYIYIPAENLVAIW